MLHVQLVKRTIFNDTSSVAPCNEKGHKRVQTTVCCSVTGQVLLHTELLYNVSEDKT